MDMSKIIPKLKVRLREELSLGGRKISYMDFTKFVNRDGHYTPLVCCPKVEETDVVLDFAPLLNVGVAELLSMLSFEGDFVNIKYLGWLTDLEFAEDWYAMLEQVNKMFSGYGDMINPTLALSESLRSSLIDYRFNMVRRIYSTLQALRLINPKSYCIALMEGMKVSFSAISMFMNPKVAFCHDSRRRYPTAQFVWESRSAEVHSRFGAIKYTPEGSDRERKISDGRGLGISALCLFILDIYNRYGDRSGVVNFVPLTNPSSRRRVTEMFEACLGDDFTGRYLRNGHYRLMDCGTRIISLGNEANMITVDCQDRKRLHNIEVGRGFIEAHILWKYAVGAKDFECTGILPPVDCTYGTRVDYAHVCLDFAFSNRGMKMSKEAVEEYGNEIIDSVLQRINVDGTLDRYRADMEKTARDGILKAQKIAEDYQRENEELTNRLSVANLAIGQKQNIIDQLREEVKSLKTKVQSIYSDEDVEGDQGVAEDVSTEEMLSFVNQFRVVVVGGIDSMQQRLEEAGFTNLYFLNNERILNNTRVNGDFFCICTKFVSHKVVYGVEVSYSDQSDSFFYFNGTNVDVFLRTCYKFMHDWFNGTNAQEVTNNG